jgi:HD-GYP domain-containing protein (c-di-GMP phosphodiesterase class II)
MTPPLSSQERQRLESGRELIVLWSALLTAVRFYAQGNDTVVSRCERIRTVVSALLDTDDEVEITAQRDSIYLNGTRIRESAVASTAYQRLARILRAASVSALVIVDEVSADELERFARLLDTAAGTRGDPASLTRELTVRGITHLTVRPATDTEELPDELTADQIARRVFLRSIDVVRAIFNEARTSDRISARRLKRAVQGMIDSLEADPTALMKLTTLKNYDEYTFGHSVNVSVLAIALGRHVGLSRHQLYTLGQSGMLHDIGKLCIPKTILNKPGRLVPEERRIVELHPLEGFLSIAQKLGASAEMIDVALTAFDHHVNLDGTGYPGVRVSRPKGLLSRIVSIVDRYDAMTSDRVYRTALQPQKALAILFTSQGSHHDPALMRYFMNLMGYYPLGTAVKLSDGSIGIVVGGPGTPEQRHLPRVQIILDAEGRPSRGLTVDLASALDAERGLRISGTIDPRAYGIEVMDYIL